MINSIADLVIVILAALWGVLAFLQII